jgi:hypothetical protein
MGALTVTTFVRFSICSTLLCVGVEQKEKKIEGPTSNHGSCRSHHEWYNDSLCELGFPFNHGPPSKGSPFFFFFFWFKAILCTNLVVVNTLSR